MYLDHEQSLCFFEYLPLVSLNDVTGAMAFGNELPWFCFVPRLRFVFAGVCCIGHLGLVAAAGPGHKG